MISLNKHSISTKIVDRYATTVYSFEFKNDSFSYVNYNNTSKELQFELTVHPESFISNFTAIIDGETFNGITKEKQKASKEYKAAKEKDENAILISQPHKDIPNIVQIKTNIDSNSEVSLHITIEQYLTKTFNYNNLDIQILRSFKKYNIIKKYEYITFNMCIKDSSGIFDIQIPSHGNIIIDEKIEDNTKCTIFGRIHSDKSSINELALKYKITGEQTDSMILFDKNSNTFCHVISDIITDSMINNTTHTLIPRRVVFVIDKSGSMSGSKWNKTTASTILALKQLRTSYDRFCVIVFDGNMDIFPVNNQIIQTNKTNVNNTIKWLQSKRAGGGTNINAPLLKAIELIKQDIKWCSHINYFMNQIFFITDGEVSNTDKIIINVKNANDLSNIDSYSSKISIFSFGISCDNNDSSWINDVNHSFLKCLAINNAGIYKRIKHSNTDKTLNEFFNILSKPILSNINIHYHNKKITNLTQTSFNTLYSGNDLIICGQFNLNKTEECELNVTVTVSAITGSNKDVNITKPINICKTMKMNIDINTSNNNHKIEKIFAYLKLKQLAEQRLKYDDMIEIDDDEKKSNDSLPLQLALKHQFITPWTSMIVVKQKNTNECQPINCSLPLKKKKNEKLCLKRNKSCITSIGLAETDESIHESNVETNSDDDVLNMDFDNNINNNDPFDTDISDESHDIISKSHNNLHVKNKHSEYDKLVFDIAHSTNTRSNSISMDKMIEKKESHSHNNKNQHTRKATPIPRKNKYRLKSPKTPNNMDINEYGHGHAHVMNKKNTLSLTEILSETNKRNYNITPQSQTQISQYLMPNPNIISPSHSIRSPTEISLDNADQYEYKVMNNGGMKEISQSYQIKPIINNNNTVQNNNNNNAAAAELANVDIIKEEHEYDTYNYNQHMHEIGLILKQPSHSNTNTNNRHIYRYKSLNKMDDNDNDNDVDNENTTATDTYINKLVTIPSVCSQHSDNNNKQNDGSMIAHFDEQSTRTLQKDFASTVNSVDYTPKSKYNSSNNTLNPKYIIERNRNKSLNIDETDEEISLVQSVQTKTKSIELVEYIDDKKIISSPHQYAIRSNITSIDIDDENNNTSTIEHQHNVVVIHKESNDNNDNNQIGNKLSICYLPCPYLNSSKAMLSMCFILGFIMGLLPGFFGYPWKFFE